ncbi:MAG: DNA/RNA non-specific endonuclease [Cyanobacteria bacterium P01_G01_bin.67]
MLVLFESFCNGTEISDYSSTGYIRGHQTANDDRNRVVLSYYPDPQTGNKYYIHRDQYQTFLTTNILPEASQLSAWQQSEIDLKNFIKDSSVPREAYIVTGRNGESNRNFQSKPRTASDGSIYTFNIDIPNEVWKVVLIPEKAGQGPLEVTEKAIAFGVLMNNINHKNQKNWQNSGISQTFSINEIESLTGLDFFSEIPDDLEEQLESRNDSGSIPLFTKANLLADSSVSGVKERSLDINSIRSSNLPEKSLLKGAGTSTINFREVNFDNSSKFKISVAEITPINNIFSHSNTVHIGSCKISTSTTTSQEICSSQLGMTQTSQRQSTSSTQHGADSDDIFQISLPQITISQSSPAQDGSAQISLFQIDKGQIRTTEIDSSQISTGKIHFQESMLSIGFKLDSGEVSFPSSISTQQLFFGDLNHINTSLFNNIYFTAKTLCNNALNLPTLPSINLEITDLPTGQLAEATITGFDTFGRPNAGTILIDYNANGVGWFIDPTPFESSEFAVQS